MEAALYLIPVTLGETEHYKVLPAYNREVILGIRHFVVENIRTARRFLKKTEPSLMIDELHFYELNKQKYLRKRSQCLKRRRRKPLMTHKVHSQGRASNAFHRLLRFRLGR